ncbi:VOC family protein [Ascidiimonas sp. W6]|uniref:VOC family protein n=1 Tax=Ascidiimonas meishanensis TaxID=3128903 RepID=UPI0030EBFA37
MKLGAFSISLSVKNINASKEFYENLGFEVFAGDIERKYLIMKNEDSLIGLFEGMFKNNILTFNPGWDSNAKELDTFDDIREIQKQLLAKGVKLDNELADGSKGPGGFMVVDPDGNTILIDQHV